LVEVLCDDHVGTANVCYRFGTQAVLAAGPS